MARKKSEPERDEEFVRTINTAFLQCRTLRHAWDLIYFGEAENAPIPATTELFSASTIIRQAKCLRCGTLKENFYGFGEIAKRRAIEEWSPFYSRYRYADQYEWHKKPDGLDRPAARDFTQELYTRFQHGSL